MELFVNKELKSEYSLGMKTFRVLVRRVVECLYFECMCLHLFILHVHTHTTHTYTTIYIYTHYTIYIIVCVFVFTSMCVARYSIWRSKDNFWESILSFHPVDPKD